MTLETKKLEYFQKQIKSYQDEAEKKTLQSRETKFKDRLGSIARWTTGIALGVAAIAGAPITIPAISAAVGGLVGMAGVVGMGAFIAGRIGRLVGSGLARSESRKNKTFQTIVNGISNLMTRVQSFFNNESFKAPENIFVDEPNPIRNLQLKTVTDLNKEVPYKEAQKIINDISEEPDRLLSELKKDNLISKDNGIKLSDLLSKLPTNPELKKEYQNLNTPLETKTPVNHTPNTTISANIVQEAQKIAESINLHPTNNVQYNKTIIPPVNKQERLSRS